MFSIYRHIFGQSDPSGISPYQAGLHADRRVAGRGLIINDGDTEYSWDFILVDASNDEQNTFDERLLRMLSDYIHAGFPDAVVRHIQHEEIILVAW